MKLKKYDSVFLVGPMASGKTTLGKLLAKRLGLKFLDTDQEVEKRSGVSIRLIFEMEGESAFRDRESKTLQALSSQAGVVFGDRRWRSAAAGESTGFGGLEVS